MRVALALLVVLLTPACAARQVPPPIEQEWIAVLLHDDIVVKTAIVTTIFPTLTWNECAPRELRLASIRGRCHARLFRFVSMDRRQRLAIYRELRPS